PACPHRAAGRHEPWCRTTETSTASTAATTTRPPARGPPTATPPDDPQPPCPRARTAVRRPAHPTQAPPGRAPGAAGPDSPFVFRCSAHQRAYPPARRLPERDAARDEIGRASCRERV